MLRSTVDLSAYAIHSWQRTKTAHNLAMYSALIRACIAENFTIECHHHVHTVSIGDVQANNMMIMFCCIVNGWT